MIKIIKNKCDRKESLAEDYEELHILQKLTEDNQLFLILSKTV